MIAQGGEMTLSNAEKQQRHRDKLQREMNQIVGYVTDVRGMCRQILDEVGWLRNQMANGYVTPPDPLLKNLPSEDIESSRKSRGRPTGSHLSEEWQPTEEQRRFATDWGLDPDVTANLFRNHWLAKTGAGATKKDWNRTWQNWCMNDKRAKKPNGHAVSEPDAVQLAEIEDFKARIRESFRSREDPQSEL
jgi:hypothetical protein